jgi:hypothetical protein
MVKGLNIDIEINLIQEIRLIHSLLDDNYVLFFNTKTIKKLEPLLKKYPDNVKIGSHRVFENISNILTINHFKPEIIFKDIQKPLIFPKSLINYCEVNCNEKIPGVFFSGLLTTKRKLVIDSLSKKTNLPLIIKNSNKGREFPQKSYDINYFNEMLKYKFILTPNGDFIWTYRFFESIMCGAIPIVEESCDIFKGFIYYSVNDTITDKQWDLNIIKTNIEFLKKNFTF